jgi:GT2 family glycosyltransferase
VPERRPDVSGLVVTWNSAEVLPEMLTTLKRASAGLEVELVHVDNASADQSASLSGELWTGRLVHRVNAQNLGFAPALKQAAEMASGEFLLMLNPDAQLEGDALPTLVGRLRADPSIGAVGPVLKSSEGEVQRFCARRIPGLLEAFIEVLGIHRLVRGTVLDPYTFSRASYAIERDVPCLSGAAMLIRSTALEAAGGIDDRFFMYFEDLDVCERIRRSGFRVRYCPSAVVTHIGAASSPRDPSLEIWLAVQNTAAINFFYRLHRGPITALAHRALVLIEGATRALVHALTRRLATTRDLSVPTSGVAKMRWALTGAVPSGGPAGIPDG